MEDANGLKNVTAARAPTLSHFFLSDLRMYSQRKALGINLTYQFWGFSGSLGPSQSTMFASLWPSVAAANCAFSTSVAWVLLGGESLASVLGFGDIIEALEMSNFGVGVTLSTS
jgi:hypothetical protein